MVGVFVGPAGVYTPAAEVAAVVEAAVEVAAGIILLMLESITSALVITVDALTGKVKSVIISEAMGVSIHQVNSHISVRVVNLQ